MKSLSLFPLLFPLLLLTLTTADAQDWPQAAGPNANWIVAGTPPTRWSVVRDENILWRTPMPETGMSAVTVCGDRAFTTIHQPIEKLEQQEQARDVIGYCLNANTGEVLWTVDLPGTMEMALADGFTDGTVFAPICDGEHVWFFNRCGSMGCFDMTGHRIWLRKYTPRFKHANRQCEPILVGDMILNVEVRDKINGAKIRKRGPNRELQKAEIPPEVTFERDVWTYIHAIDKRTGKVVWQERAGTSVHNTPIFGMTADGKPAVVHGRGGGHGPLEKPYGISLTLIGGRTLWSSPLPGFSPEFSLHWNSDEVYAFYRGEHIVLDARSGRVLRTQPIQQPDSLWTYDRNQESWVFSNSATVKPTKKGKNAPNTNQANLVYRDWHYFLCHDEFYLGRVHVKTGTVEYLELPAQMVASQKNRDADLWLWGQGQKNTPVNAAGLAIGRKGHNGTGWGHISAASPTAVGPYLFIPVVTGTTYVIDTRVEQLSPDSLVAVNDLGPGGETWSLASFSYANGRLYQHTMREVICIGE
ncbi:MAG: PQQ-binding-like beta-propeller repeat protein [Planctomycetaceae bacterium]|nr:PQQ-binding-like beta-propeller repeat protein [Planctomycetaceae bacterium]